MTKQSLCVVCYILLVEWHACARQKRRDSIWDYTGGILMHDMFYLQYKSKSCMTMD